MTPPIYPLDKYSKEETTMNGWKGVLAAMDSIFGHGCKKASRISKKVQGFDNQTGEHIIRVEYRVKLLNEDGEDTGRSLLSELLSCSSKRD
jgi:hypothetical protein